MFMLQQYIRLSLIVVYSISSLGYLSGQEESTNLAIESFYSEKKTILSKDYDAKDFRDVFPFDPGDYLVRGREKFEEKFYNESLIDFHRSIELAKDCSVCHYFRGLNYLVLDSLSLAKKDMITAIDLDPLLIEGYNDLSHIYAAQYNIDSAKYYLKKGIDFFPAYSLTYYNLGVIELLDNNRQKAVKQFKKSLEFAPCNHNSQVYLVLFYLQNGMRNKATAMLDKMLECNPDFTDIYFLKAILRYYDGKKKLAINLINQAIEKDPSEYIYFFLRGQFHLQLNNFENATEDITKAYTLNPLLGENYNGSRSYREKQERNQYVLAYYAAKKFNYSEDQIKQLDKIICMIFEYKYTYARKAIDKFVLNYPGHALAYLLLANIENDIGNGEEALRYYNTAISIDSKMTEGYRRRGLLYQKKLNFKEAIINFNKMYASAPSETHALKLRGIARAFNEEYMLALIDFDFYSKIDTMDTDVNFNKGFCESKMGKHQAAIKSFEKVIKIKPKDKYALFQIANNKYFLGDTLGAVSMYDSALVIVPCFLDALNAKGIIYMDQKNYNAALDVFDQIVDCTPYLPQAYTKRSYVNYKNGNYQDALFDINKSLKMFKEDGYAYLLRAKIKKAIQNKSACKDLKKAIELGETISEEIKQSICPE